VSIQCGGVAEINYSDAYRVTVEISTVYHFIINSKLVFMVFLVSNV
jgi:hypothetical protein